MQGGWPEEIDSGLGRLLAVAPRAEPDGDSDISYFDLPELVSSDEEDEDEAILEMPVSDHASPGDVVKGISKRIQAGMDQRHGMEQTEAWSRFNILEAQCQITILMV